MIYCHVTIFRNNIAPVKHWEVLCHIIYFHVTIFTNTMALMLLIPLFLGGYRGMSLPSQISVGIYSLLSKRQFSTINFVWAFTYSSSCL
jgi:hypothetical protein